MDETKQQMSQYGHAVDNMMGHQKNMNAPSISSLFSSAIYNPVQLYKSTMISSEIQKGILNRMLNRLRILKDPMVNAVWYKSKQVMKIILPAL